MRNLTGILGRCLLAFGTAIIVSACGGASNSPSNSNAAPPAPTVGLTSVIPDSNTLTEPPTKVVATFSAKVDALNSGFFKVSGTCAILPTATSTVDASGEVVTITLTGSNCLGGQSLSLTLDPSKAVLHSSAIQPGAVWSRTYSIPLGQQSIGGQLTGLVGTLVLVVNGGDALTLHGDGQYVFPTLVQQNNAYSVTVQTQPANQTCTVSNGTGVIGASAIQNVDVVCAANAYTVGGQLSGLVGTLALQDNGGDDLTLNANGTFTFATSVAEGSPYDITIATQPATQTCTVGNGTGTMGSTAIGNVQIACSTNSFTVGGTVSGLVGSVVLQNNAGDHLAVSSDGSFVFDTPVAQAGTYNVTVLNQPTTQICTVLNGSGIVGNGNVANLIVSCVTSSTIVTVDSTGVIPVNGGTASLTVTNTGTVLPAANVHAVLPSGWSGVTQNATDCISVAAGRTCTLTFTSTTPYVAQANIEVTGDDVVSPPTTALAFSIGGYDVFSVDSASRATVIDTGNLGDSSWGPTSSTTAVSLVDGASNTSILAGLGQGGAAAACASSTRGGVPAGTWYLPALCQLAPSGFEATCPTSFGNIQTNLAQYGFGAFVAGALYWSSTDGGQLADGYEFGSPDGQFGGSKTFIDANIRCVRSISY